MVNSYLLYKSFWKLITPLVKYYFKRRGKKDKRYTEHLEERFAGVYDTQLQSFILKCQAEGSIHIHAASLGEVNLISSFVLALDNLKAKNLLKEKFNRPIIITTNTPTGRQAASKLKDQLNLISLEVVYTPLEYEKTINKFIQDFNPSLSIFVETEIWPLLIKKLKEHNSLYLVNARISEKNLAKNSKGLLRKSIDKFDKIVCQNYLNALLYSAVLEGKSQISTNLEVNKVTYSYLDNAGSKNETCYFHAKADKSKLYIGNNLKFNRANYRVEDQLFHLLYKKFRQQGKVNLLVSSTYPDEVKLILHSSDLTNFIIAPRHPENFAKVAEYCQDNGFVVTYFSTLKERFYKLIDQVYAQIDGQDKDIDHLNHLNNKLGNLWLNLEELLGFNHPQNVLLVDTIGDLNNLYQLADITVVGGTFNKIGGHDVIAPISYLNSVIVGPNFKNQQAVVEELINLNALNLIKDTETVKSTLEVYLKSYLSERQKLNDKLIYIDENTDLKSLSLEYTYLGKEYLAYKYFLSQQNALINHLKILGVI
ncbi:hypothetical protein CKF54_03465 [Psittacicella hinzii]|uniref:3-deoxy-D-manno-octulosonic acid transferase n=1 Tax=Psittacicella hinzii TaxID=2028575 RepID=A0A3A1Y767_9GAMM|nr:glycosyltransferase N-terminal domain-containing protein [Psittacicella hinzii]RIY33120.1 hypothetical protein CKF54_03465 [Psittacicella hinzii]